MSLKDLFCLVYDKKPYDLSGLDTSKTSVREMIAYVNERFSEDVEYISILSYDDSFLDELLNGEDLTMRISGALSKINSMVPDLQLKSYV